MTFHQYWLALKKRLYLILNKRYFVKKIGDIYFLLDILNYIDRQIEAFDGYEKQQVDFFIMQFKNYNCQYFLDIGAHWGYYSLLVANNFKLSNINVIAFEPDVINRNQFYANIFLNRLQEKIKIYDYALSNHSDVVRFSHHNDENRGRSRVSDDGTVLINTIKGDDVINFLGQNIAIKIDVEGHEKNVIEGMLKLLKNNNCFIQIESFDGNYSELHNQLLKMQYNLINKIGNDYYYTNINNNAI